MAKKKAKNTKKQKKTPKSTPKKRAAKRLVSPQSVAEFSARHVKAIYDGLKIAGLGKFKIATLMLEPVAGSADTQSNCVPVKLPDGSWTLKC
jgi:hypothetical protein